MSYVVSYYLPEAGRWETSGPYTSKAQALYFAKLIRADRKGNLARVRRAQGAGEPPVARPPFMA